MTAPRKCRENVKKTRNIFYREKLTSITGRTCDKTPTLQMICQIGSKMCKNILAQNLQLQKCWRL